MKFLIDECLHTSLVALAHKSGHAADHVSYFGLRGWKDWQLVKKAIADEYVFVTNNAHDFIRLYRREPLHCGLIVILPNVTPAGQRDLFQATLEHIGRADLVNMLVEVRYQGSGIECRQYDFGSNYFERPEK